MTVNVNLVKVVVLGGKVAEVGLADGATVEDALLAAGIEIPEDPEDLEINVNKRAADLSDEVFDRDIVVLVPNIEGGAK